MPFHLKQALVSELVIKKSRFMGWVGPCPSREEAQTMVRQAWQEHPGATHVCWALMAGGHSAAVDDGEPSGTAGRPMLEVLRHHDLQGVLAMVVRYYGGTPLGAGGLARAYTDAVAQALQGAEKIPFRAVTPLYLRVPYEQEGLVRRELEAFEAALVSVEHTQEVLFALSLPADQQAAFTQRIRDASHGKAVYSEHPL